MNIYEVARYVLSLYDKNHLLIKTFINKPDYEKFKQEQGYV